MTDKVEVTEPNRLGASDAPNEAMADSEIQQRQQRVSRLYQDYHRPLVATLRKMYGDGPPDPEDVANEAFHRIVARDDVGSIDNLKAFVWRIAKNIVLKSRRDSARRSRRDFDVENIFFPEKSYESTPERIIEAREQLRAINLLLRTMPETRRHAFILHRIEGLSITETARNLGMSRPGAAKHIARAAAQINELFSSDEA
ncbi:MAG: sigma-70 family RNA polymerase sigma factor [Pseudomonadota bacterium]